MLDVGGTDPAHREGERGSLSGLALITHQGTNDRESHRDKERERKRTRERDRKREREGERERERGSVK